MHLATLFRRRPLLPRARAISVRPRVETLEQRTMLSVNLVEVEANDTLATANPVTLVRETDMIVSGSVSPLGDRDWFRVELKAGDVIGGALSGQSGLDPAVRLVDACGTLLIANDNADFIGNALPPESPLPRDESHAENAEFYYVINTSGAYYVEVSASNDASTGKYNLDLVVARPGLEKQPVGTRQILFVDFDGAKVNMSTYGGSGTTTLSPLSSFLADWGLTAGDENAVIDSILASIKENLSDDVRARGLNGDFASSHRPGDFDIDIRNSRDNADEFGKNPFVSRVVIGGTQAEFSALPPGFGALANSVDPGNFRTDDDAVVTLSQVKPVLDLIPIKAPHTRIEMIGLALGQLAAHVAGHYFGNFTTDRSLTDPFSGLPNIMDNRSPSAGRSGRTAFSGPMTTSMWIWAWTTTSRWSRSGALRTASTWSRSGFPPARGWCRWCPAPALLQI